jgi:hypothetical protein
MNKKIETIKKKLGTGMPSKEEMKLKAEQEKRKMAIINGTYKATKSKPENSIISDKKTIVDIVKSKFRMLTLSVYYYFVFLFKVQSKINRINLQIDLEAVSLGRERFERINALPFSIIPVSTAISVINSGVFNLVHIRKELQEDPEFQIVALDRIMGFINNLEGIKGGIHKDGLYITVNSRTLKDDLIGYIKSDSLRLLVELQ